MCLLGWNFKKLQQREIMAETGGYSFSKLQYRVSIQYSTGCQTIQYSTGCLTVQYSTGCLTIQYSTWCHTILFGFILSNLSASKKHTVKLQSVCPFSPVKNCPLISQARNNLMSYNISHIFSLFWSFC